MTLHGTGDERKAMDLSAIFRSGNNVIDERRGYVNARLAQELLEKPSMVSMIIVTLRDPERAPALADHFERLFAHRSRSWQEREARQPANFYHACACRRRSRWARSSCWRARSFSTR